MTDFTKDELRGARVMMGDTIVIGGRFVAPGELIAFALAQVEAREDAERSLGTMSGLSADRLKSASEWKARAEAAEAALEREKRARDEDVEVMECYRDAVLFCTHEPDVIAQHLGEVNARLAAHKEDRK